MESERNTLPDLGVEGDCGVLDVNEQLMSLGNQDDPVIVVRERKAKLRGKPGSKMTK